MRSERWWEEGRVRWWQRGWVRGVGVVLACGMMGLGAAGWYVARHAEPILKKKVVETLEARFHSPVELDGLSISVAKGLEVQGTGLRILSLVGADEAQGSTPMVSVQSFTFRTRMWDVLHDRTHVGLVYAYGMEVHIPPGEKRAVMFGASGVKGEPKPKVAVLVDQIFVNGMKLIIDTDKPGKEPLEFDIKTVDLHDVGMDKPLLYSADLLNPKPVGEIHAEGHFGPWDLDDPRETAVDGTYRFEHADLSTIKGIGGMLSSIGTFVGELGKIAVDGTTETPDFYLDISDHPVPLHTQFHAIVDGTTGDTTLDPVQAQLIHTSFTCRGTVMRVPGKGHDIALTVDMPSGRLEDVLTLGTKSKVPMMRAAMSMRAKLHLPPGPERVAAKLELAGTVGERGISYGNPKVQDKIDSLSMRAQGRPEEAKAAGSDGKAQVASQLQTGFALGHGVATFRDVKYSIPGALVELNGAYSMDRELFEFKGHVKTDATASQMVTGWKSLLLKPVDRFLKKNGAGMELPIEISGTKSDFHFGLTGDGGADESADQIAADLRRPGGGGTSNKQDEQ